MQRLPNRLIKMLQENELTLALAESVTCGLAAHQLNTVKGTMDVLKGSLVCYHPETKITLLGISKRMIEKHTAESAPVTNAIAKGLRRLFSATIYAGVTGLAAPGGSETKSKPVGTVFLSVHHGHKIYSERKRFQGSPLQIKKKACEALYRLIIKVVKKLL